MAKGRKGSAPKAPAPKKSAAGFGSRTGFAPSAKTSIGCGGKK